MHPPAAFARVARSNPLPFEARLDEIDVEERFAARYEEFARWHWWFQGRERILASVLRRELAKLRMPSGARTRVVAVGCGPPQGLAWAASALGRNGHVIGIDPDASGAYA